MGCVKSTPDKAEISAEDPYPLCFLEIDIDGTVIGRLVLELREDVVPLTVANFKGLCTDQPVKGYKGTTLHRIIPGFMAQGGDSGTSIYGKRFKDENFVLEHVARGTLSMANRGPDTNNTQFFITFAETPHLDGKHVVFGKVVRGLNLLDQIEAVGSKSGETSKTVTISDCGVIK